MAKKDLTETEICMRYITPALEAAGWDAQRQIRREATFTDGRIIVRGKLVARGNKKRADYMLFYQRNMPLPRLDEQRRIVKRCSAIVTLCADLERTLSLRKETATRLAAAVAGLAARNVQDASPKSRTGHRASVSRRDLPSREEGAR